MSSASASSTSFSLRDMEKVCVEGKATRNFKAICYDRGASTLSFMPRKLFVTTALPYANGPFHIGHMMEYVQADIWVRFQRLQGHKVTFVCADDAHGAPIMLKAEAEGITPEELVARVADGHKRDWQRYGISFDHTYTTHSDEDRELSI